MTGSHCDLFPMAAGIATATRAGLNRCGHPMRPCSPRGRLAWRAHPP